MVPTVDILNVAQNAGANISLTLYLLFTGKKPHFFVWDYDWPWLSFQTSTLVSARWWPTTKASILLHEMLRFSSPPFCVHRAKLWKWYYTSGTQFSLQKNCSGYFKREPNHLSMISARRFDTSRQHRCNQNRGRPIVEHCLLSCRNLCGMNSEHTLRCQLVYQRPRLKKPWSQQLLHHSRRIILSVYCMLNSLPGVLACWSSGKRDFCCHMELP